MPIYRNISKYIYKPSTPLKKAVRDLYQKKINICLICNEKNNLVGLLTLSDIKKAILDGIDPGLPIAKTMNTEYVWANHLSTEKNLKALSLKKNKYGTGAIEKIPLIDMNHKLKGLYINNSLSTGFEYKTVFVTGGAGYVGSILSRKLLEKGYRVIVLDKLIFGKESIKPLLGNKNFSFLEGDIGNINDLISGVKDADCIIHLAGIVGDPASSLNPLQTMESNHFSTKSLIELSKYYPISKLIFASSCSVYGVNKKVLNEKSKVRPISLYARTKVSSEYDLLSAKSDYFHPVILRFGTLYGISPRMRFDLAINIMAAHAYFNKKITVNGGTQWRPFLHVSDAAEACIAAIEAPLNKTSGQIFNVGSENQNFTIRQIAQRIQDVLPRTKIIELSSTIDKRNYQVSFAKIEKTLDFRVKVDIDNGIKEIIDAFKNGKYKNFTDARFSNYLSMENE